MSLAKASLFTIEELVIPAMFPRSTPLSTSHSTDRLKIACKLYTPKNDKASKPSSPSLLFVTGNGFPKECYEPMLEQFYKEMSNRFGINLKYILSIDAVNQGQSAIINEYQLGNDFIWSDSWRDLALIQHYFVTNNHPIVESPLIGAGHSFGGNVVFGSTTINKKMFKAILGIDPVLSPPHSTKNELNGGILPGALSYKRRDLWSSREEAATKLRSNPYYGGWEDTVFQNYIKYGLRDLPTAKYPSKSEGVTLSCPVTQELATFNSLPGLDELHNEDTDHHLIQHGPFEGLKVTEKSEVPTHLLLTDIGRINYDFGNYDNMKKNPNISFNYMDKKFTHSLPMEHPSDAAKAMADFFGTKLEHAIKKEEATNELSRYRDIHPYHWHSYTKFHERNKNAKL